MPEWLTWIELGVGHSLFLLRKLASPQSRRHSCSTEALSASWTATDTSVSYNSLCRNSVRCLNFSALPSTGASDDLQADKGH